MTIFKQLSINLIINITKTADDTGKVYLANDYGKLSLQCWVDEQKYFLKTNTLISYKEIYYMLHFQSINIVLDTGVIK